MSQEALHVIQRLFKALIFVPTMGLVFWWIFCSLLDGTITTAEAAIGGGLLLLALLLGVVSIITGGWGFVGIMAFIYLALLALAAWEFIYWRRREKEYLEGQVRKYQQATADDASNAAAYSFLGETQLRLRRFEEAARAFEQALKLDPESRSDRTGLALAESRRSRPRWRKLD
jgi:cytochrome c-type biogenesis protein CcmH/NrfG